MRSFSTYIKTIAKKVGEGIRISADALSEGNAMADRIAQAVALGVRRELLADTKASTISDEKVLGAYELLAPENIFLIGRDKARTALDKYNASEDDRSRLEAKAGLMISVSLCRTYLLSFSPKKTRISRTAPIVLAAIIEAVLEDILSRASNSARDSGRATVQPRDIMVSINSDVEVTALTRVIDYDQRSGGVMPFIHVGLIQSKKTHKKSKKAKTNAGNGWKAHRFLPGTVSLRRIRQHQKSATNVVNMTTSRRIIEDALPTGDAKYRISKQAHSLLHELLESEAVRVMEDAVRITVHSKRTQTSGKDLRLAISLRGNGLDDMLSGYKKMLKKPEITRLSYRGGVKTRTESFFDEANTYITGFITWVVSKAVRATIAAGRKTLFPVDVGLALDALSIPHGGL